MKKILHWLLCSTLAFPLRACFSVPNFKAEPARPTLPLIILAGQSNMQGVAGDAAVYPDDPNQLDPMIPFYWVIPGTGLSSPNWTSLGPQEQLFPAGHFGPEISFARSLTQAAGDSVAIFKFSMGGDWPGSGLEATR